MLPTLLISPVWAAEFQVTPTFSLGQTYTDNVSLAPAGLERSDWVTVARPGVGFTYNGGKLRFTAAYTAEIVYRASESGIDVNNQYTGGTIGSLELVPQLLFLDTNSTVSQYNTSINRPLATSNINTTDNRATVRTTVIAPHIRYNFGGEAIATARWAYSMVTSDTGSASFSDSGGSAITLNLASGPGYVATGWDLRYIRDKVDYDVGRDYTLQSFLATARRRITSVLGVSASAGYEDNDYATLTGEQPSGATWNVGINWTPTPRTNLAATAGRRFFGKTYSFDFTHRMRTLFVNANYRDEITTTRAQFLVPTQADTTTFLDTLLLSRIPDPVLRQQAVREQIALTGLPPTLLVPVNFLTDQVFLQRSWHASAGLQGPLHTFVADFFTSVREQQTPGLPSGSGDFALSPEVEQYGGSFSWSYRVTSHTSSVVSLGYTRNEPGSGQEGITKYTRLSLNTQFSPKMIGVVSYQRTHNDSSAATGGYTENQVTANLQVNF